MPAVAFGETVGHLPELIDGLYTEARNCMAVNAFTGAVMLCRKLLMHVAVSQGADAGKAFAFYVGYIADNGYVPPNARKWVDHIRGKGNEANHEIHLMDRAAAQDLITFTEMLLKLVFEYPSRVPE